MRHRQRRAYRQNSQPEFERIAAAESGAICPKGSQSRLEQQFGAVFNRDRWYLKIELQSGSRLSLHLLMIVFVLEWNHASRA